MGLQQTGRVSNILNKPFNMNSASETKYEQMQRSRLDPLWEQRAQQQEANLIARGVRPGSEAYNQMMGQFNQSRNDAYNQMYVQGKGLFNQEALAERNQPLNEITALMSGSQVQQPNFVGTPQTGVANTDVAGIHQNAYNAQLQNHNSMMGGLFGLAAAPFGMFSFGSDRRLKKNIRLVGKYENGLNKYEWNYIWGGPKKVGVMADEVEKVMPEAVFEVSGYKAVRYDMIGA